MSKPKLIFAYILLVGIPLLGLLAILRAGERLTPPRYLGGAWTLEADFTSLANQACRNLFSSLRQPFLSISQSGPALDLTLNNSQRTTLPGTLENSSLTVGVGRRASPSAGGNCLDPQAIWLRAEIAQQAGQRILIGTLGVAGCPGCSPIPFRAQRQDSSPRESR